MRFQHAGFRGAALCAVTLTAVAAQADVKIVSKMKVNAFGGNQDAVVTTYYKGSKVRTESPGTLQIYDATTKQAIVINQAEKTYSIITLGQQGGKMPNGMKIKTTGSTKATNLTRTIAGKPARKYSFDGTITMASDKQEGSAKIILHMDQWTTTAIKGAMTPSQMMGTMGQMLQGMGALGAGLKNLTSEMSKIKGMPLDLAMDMSMAASGPNSPQGMNFKITMSSAVQSISEAPLSASLFQIPKGYKKVNPPTRRGMPRRG